MRGVKWLGDAVISTAALQRLREAHPEMHIAMLTPEKLADLWSGQPFINEVISFNPLDGTGAVSRRLRAGRFDTALVFPNSFRAAFEMWLAGIPSRIGFGGRGRKLLLTSVLPRRREDVPMRKRTAAEIAELARAVPARARESFSKSAHQIHHYLRLAAALGASPEPVAPRICVSEAERAAVREKFGLSGPTVFALNPGAEYGPAKRWPAERFAETVLLVHSRRPAHWILLGGPGDRASADQIIAAVKQRAPAVQLTNTAGKTSLIELRALLAIADAVLTNDTGPMHLAAAAGARVIVPFGSTSPELTGPGLPGDPRHSIILGAAPCAPCFLRECPIDFRCMFSITPETVARAFIE